MPLNGHLSYNVSTSLSHISDEASLGIRQSPRGLIEILPTFGPSGKQERLNCLPDGPKVGSISISPRGDWRMPSDASSEMWLREVETL